MSRTILITGASSSFGQELIARLPSDANIIAVSRQLLINEMSDDPRVINVVADLSKTDFLNNFDNKIDFSQVDELVHFAAAPMRMQNFSSNTSDQLLHDYQTNFLSVVALLTKVVATRKQNPRQIRVVLMLTDMLRSAKKGETSYITSKFALLGLVNSLSTEFSGNELRINAVSPSLVETKYVGHFPEFLRKDISNKHPMKRHCTVSEVIDSVEFLLSPQSSFISGQNIFINGGEN
jgi:3-oxoacyl-[acyl-carrier protein] reductase